MATVEDLLDVFAPAQRRALDRTLEMVRRRYFPLPTIAKSAPVRVTEF